MCYFKDCYLFNFLHIQGRKKVYNRCIIRTKNNEQSPQVFSRPRGTNANEICLDCNPQPSNLTPNKHSVVRRMRHRHSSVILYLLVCSLWHWKLLLWNSTFKDQQPRLTFFYASVISFKENRWKTSKTWHDFTCALLKVNGKKMALSFLRLLVQEFYDYKTW